MDKFDIPFLFTRITYHSGPPFEDGHLIFTLYRCGLFFCRRGEVEVSMEEKRFCIRPGGLYLYMPSTLVRIVRKSADAEGFIIEADTDYAILLTNKVINVENLLFIRSHPLVSLNEAQSAHLLQLLEGLQARIDYEERSTANSLRSTLIAEVLKSMGQTLFYEALNLYFANQTSEPQPQDKKETVFRNFILALFRCYRQERDVAYYAGLQHITPRYFSSIIKEKSGSHPSEWIVRMVITEAKLLLEESELSIKEIAMRLNFPTQSFFGKYFKQYVGLSPKDYRKRLMEKKKAAPALQAASGNGR